MAGRGAQLASWPSLLSRAASRVAARACHGAQRACISGDEAETSLRGTGPERAQ